MHKQPVDPRGIEPPTLSLQMTRSTSELRARVLVSKIFLFNC